MLKPLCVCIASIVVAACFASPAAAQPAQGSAAADGPKEAIYITDEQVKTVLKNAPPAVDQQLRVVDMGEYQLAVGVIHRGPTGGARGAGRGAAAGGGAGAGRGAGGAGGGAARGAGAAAAAPQPCGATATPGAKPSGVTGIAHDATTETYIITSGAGTLVTGGTIVNGRRSAPGTQVTDVLNGPSCSGAIEGTIVRQTVKVGDIIIIPAGVPHGWTDIADHVTYLSVRPDPDEVLQKGYVHPDLK
jgi:mannose-6-phosphate isomerase-like protein (cupin superfamily)